MTENEQPYEIPNNWRWTKLSKVLSISRETTTDFSSKDLKYVGLENMMANCGIVSFGNVEKIKSSKNVFKTGQILYGKLRPYLNKHAIAPFDGICSTDIVVFDNSDDVMAEYLNHYFDSAEFLNYIIPKARGNTLPRVTKKDVLEAECPLPPLDEQKRIVAIIESLFVKLDRARSLAQNVVDSYELRRGKILYDTFKRLDCEYSKIGDVCDFIGGGTPSKKIDEYWNGDIPWASVKDVKGYYLFKTIDKITELGLKNSSANLCEVDDLLLVTRMAPGKTIVSKIVTAINQDLKIIKSELPSKYLHYYFNYIRQDIENKSRGTTVNGIKVETIKDFEIPIPTIEEQREIACHLDSLLTKEQRTKELAESVLNRIEKMKKKILGMAFRGDL